MKALGRALGGGSRVDWMSPNAGTASQNARNSRRPVAA
jgi:hypothetical protein